jgi:hypothetical protein
VIKPALHVNKRYIPARGYIRKTNVDQNILLGYQEHTAYTGCQIYTGIIPVKFSLINVGSSSVPVRLYNAGVVRVYAQCHDVAVDFGWRACVERFAQTSTREPLMLGCRAMQFGILL